MPTYETYVEVPIRVEFRWRDGRAEPTGIELRTDGGCTFGPAVKDGQLPKVCLQEWLCDRELEHIKREIEEDAAESNP